MTSPSLPAPGKLRANCLAMIESVAQALSLVAPSGTIAIYLPLLIAKVGDATWLLFTMVLCTFVLVMLSITRFASVHAAAGSLTIWPRLGLGAWAEPVTGWILIFIMAFSIPCSVLCIVSYLDLFLTHFLGPTGLLPRVVFPDGCYHRSGLVDHP